MTNDVLNTIQNRRSVKKFLPDSVPADIVDAIAQAGLYAANGMGKQSPIILEITDKSLRDRLSALNALYFPKEIADPFYGAPVVLVVLADKSVPTYLYDGSLAMGNLLLAAQSLGVGACWIHRAKQMFDSEEGKKILAELGVAGDYEGIGNCVLGYPDGELRPAPEIKENRLFKA